LQDPEFRDGAEPWLAEHGEVDRASGAEDLHVPDVFGLLGVGIRHREAEIVLHGLQGQMHQVVARLGRPEKVVVSL
jgi:hypothetical protein